MLKTSIVDAELKVKQVEEQFTRALTLFENHVDETEEQNHSRKNEEQERRHRQAQKLEQLKAELAQAESERNSLQVLVQQKECTLQHLRLENQRLEQEVTFVNEKLAKLREDQSQDAATRAQIDTLKQEIAALKKFHSIETEGLCERIKELQGLRLQADASMTFD